MQRDLLKRITVSSRHKSIHSQYRGCTEVLRKLWRFLKMIVLQAYGRYLKAVGVTNQALYLEELICNEFEL